MVTATTRNVVTVEGSPFKIELFRLSPDAHDQQRFQRRVAIEVAGRTIHFPTAEDVIITKLRWLQAAGRAKDRSDLRDVLRVQGDRLDWSYLHSWCDQHGTRELLEEILREVK